MTLTAWIILMKSKEYQKSWNDMIMWHVTFVFTSLSVSDDTSIHYTLSLSSIRLRTHHVVSSWGTPPQPYWCFSLALYFHLPSFLGTKLCIYYPSLNHINSYCLSLPQIFLNQSMYLWIIPWPDPGTVVVRQKSMYISIYIWIYFWI